ncbi:hypothetical protein AU255_10640 [Methyloprofundus sedimenti]|uniref:SPOR domain-containing protein n=1 Tax=Methyloprofundus sedimenti TaxID=1420851 RepID=A0A1V8M9M4_9GAMM|nr:hypothetical protein [Methyloprofundus sedimenti]OQK18259.1 hypothetical protein AU255_10640 [Methyloprofundus sedimenti]
MKFIFSLVLLINITFFLWEYRKGAPDIYLPPPIDSANSDTQKIILLSNSPAIAKESIQSVDTAEGELVSNAEKQAETVDEIEAMDYVDPRQLNASNQSKLSDTDSKNAETSEFVDPVYQQPAVIQEDELPAPVNEQFSQPVETVRHQEKEGQPADSTLSDAEKNQTIKHVASVVACYQLKTSATKADFISQTDKQTNYTLAFAGQKVPYISNYIVLTLPAETLQLAQNRQKILKLQGIKDLWLFEKGIFKWRISLGLFSTLEKAEFAKQQYARLTSEPLDVAPSWQTHSVTQVTISAEQEQDISAFEQRFAKYIDKDLDCSEASP